MTEGSSFRLSIDLLGLAARNLVRRPLRSLLTVLGIAIGMTAVVGLLGLTGGVQRALERQFERLGHDLVLILPAMPQGAAPAPAVSFDLERIHSVPGVAQAGALLRQTLPIVTSKMQGFLAVVGLSSEMFPLAERFFERFELAAGQLPEEGSVLLTQEAARDLKLNVGDVVSIANRAFRISGVLLPTGETSIEGAILMSLPTLWELVGRRDLVTLAWVVAQPGYDVEVLSASLQEALRPMGSFNVQSSRRLNQIIQGGLEVLRAALTAIAAVALLVGGLGLMNTMYMAVLERRREIGILMSLGARRSQIWVLFLLEAGLLGLLGGGVGAILGSALALSLAALIAQASEAQPFTPTISFSLVAFALLFSMGLGMLAGLLPAHRAARLSPVEALRYE